MCHSKTSAGTTSRGQKSPKKERSIAESITTINLLWAMRNVTAYIVTLTTHSPDLVNIEMANRPKRLVLSKLKPINEAQ